MDNKLTGVLIALALILGAGGGSLIFDTDKPLYVCESKDLISDCINGVKADGQRCYYNATNARKYSYCAEGWQPFDQGAMIDKTGPNEGPGPITKGVVTSTCYKESIGCIPNKGG